MSSSTPPIELYRSGVNDPARSALREFLLSDGPGDIEEWCGMGLAIAYDNVLDELRNIGIGRNGRAAIEATIEPVQVSIGNDLLPAGAGIKPVNLPIAQRGEQKEERKLREYIIVSPSLLLRICDAFLEAESYAINAVEPDYFHILRDAADVCSTVGLWEKILSTHMGAWRERKRRSVASHMGLQAITGCLENVVEHLIDEPELRPGRLEGARELFMADLLPSKRPLSMPSQTYQAFKEVRKKPEVYVAALDEFAQTIDDTYGSDTRVLELDQRRRKSHIVPPVVAHDATITNLFT